MFLSIPTPSSNLSSIRVLSYPYQLNLLPKFSQLSISKTRTTTIIRNGGGPRTYPGGVSKWQWKRMQSKKAKQLLKARLCRERQIYEMRKRAELRAAVSELERPWEIVEKAPTLFSVRADEQLKVLADRFQKPGGYDLWSDNDGPQLFQSFVDDDDCLPSARFFPKGVVHSIKPYQKLEISDDSEGFNEFDSQSSSLEGKWSNGYRRKSRKNSNRRDTGGDDGDQGGKRSYSKRLGFLGMEEERVKEKDGLGSVDERNSSRAFNGSKARNGSRRNSTTARGNLGSDGLNSNGPGRKEMTFKRRDGRYRSSTNGDDDPRVNARKGYSSRTQVSKTIEVYDMSLKQDGSYEFQ